MAVLIILPLVDALTGVYPCQIDEMTPTMEIHVSFPSTMVAQLLRCKFVPVLPHL